MNGTRLFQIIHIKQLTLARIDSILTNIATAFQYYKLPPFSLSFSSLYHECMCYFPIDDRSIELRSFILYSYYVYEYEYVYTYCTVHYTVCTPPASFDDPDSEYLLIM